MTQFSEVVNLSFLLVPDFLDSDERAPETAAEHGALCARAQPAQFTDLLERNVPVLVTLWEITRMQY